MLSLLRRFTQLVAVLWISSSLPADGSLFDSLDDLQSDQAVVVLLDVPQNDADAVVEFCQQSSFTLYVQSENPQQIDTLRQKAEAAGLLGKTLFADPGSLGRIHLADNVADAILVSPSAEDSVSESELLRVLHPRAAAVVNGQKIVKSVPEEYDDWSHPYHGPDNNPQSNDQLVRGELRTQFIGYPKFSPMPEQSVIAGGRIYKAMGHIAHKANQNEMLNTLLCINAFNGSVIWKRELSPGFMIHRNTMIATEDALYLGDHESCKIFDGETGELRDQIKVSTDISDGPVWKWMGISDGVLYALVGNPEVSVETIRSARRGLGHWPWGMWEGHDYKDPRTAFGFGRTFVAVDLKTQEILWHYRDEEFLDARAVCMKSGRLFFYCPETFLGCLNTADGQLLWKNSDDDLLEAIGPNGKAQHYVTGYASTCYMKCDDRYLFFAGPQRSKLVVASVEDGGLAWDHPDGNLQLVLRRNGIYAAGPKTTGLVLDYDSGKQLASLPARRACTRATGCADSLFYRTSGGTVRIVTEDSQSQHVRQVQHIAPMRPPCQDGVLISNGHLYWGPWMCGCQLSLYGNIGLSPRGDRKSTTDVPPQLVTAPNADTVEPLGVQSGDWLTLGANNARSGFTTTSIPDEVESDWTAALSPHVLPTAPIAAGHLVFVADRAGTVRALDHDGALVWKAYTSGPVYYPPAVADDRLFVGSADGRVYAYEAATGRLLWHYRVAPEERWIPVYGSLISTWPVAGGIVVQDGTVYAAAGIAHYDQTHVVALDARTGELKAENSTSGSLSEDVNSGISLQGQLEIVNDELRFVAGGVYERARYDLQTLECLNTPKNQITSQYHTAFYPYYPGYGRYPSMDHTFDDGTTLSLDASYEGDLFSRLTLLAALPADASREAKEASRWNRLRHISHKRRRGEKVDIPSHLWKDDSDRRVTGFAVTADRLLIAGHPDGKTEEPFLTAITVADGTNTWSHPLPANAVKGGVAMDRDSRIYVALETGQLVCFRPNREQSQDQ